MKKSFVISIFLVCFLPVILLLFVRNTQEEIVQTPTTESSENNVDAEQLYVSVLIDGTPQTIPLEQYVLCVVLAEMPADFEFEALKAQAVVARTYTCKKILNYKHDNAAVCTDSGCCQAYISEKDYIEDGGKNESIKKVKNAVLETAGEVLIYNGKLIDATYFSCSGGKTEDAQAVWGADVPYLQSVDSPGEEHATHYIDTVSFSANEFRGKLGIQMDKPVSIGQITYTQGGGVASIEICGNQYSGTKVRSLLGLRSTAFVITAVTDTVTVTTKGFGHRVGMSQYGADAMALTGKSYKDILAHYYQGTILQKLSG